MFCRGMPLRLARAAPLSSIERAGQHAEQHLPSLTGHPQPARYTAPGHAAPQHVPPQLSLMQENCSQTTSVARCGRA